MVTVDQFVNDLQALSRSSAKLARKLGEFESSAETLFNIVASRISDEAVGILIEELRKAISVTDEYNDPIYRTKLLEVFSNPAMIQLDRTGAHIMPQAMILAGTWSELDFGIDAARASLGLGRLERTRALAFWKHRIYRPAREGLKVPRRFKKNLGFYKGAKRGERIPFDYVSYGTMKYRTTVETRMSFWGDKAPFWLWLNFGNAQKGEGYPAVEPTHFIAHSERRINQLLEQRIIDVTNEFTDAVSREVEAFLRNPKAYQPGQELDRFIVEGAEFQLGVTPGGELGVRRIG
jgi:hypothetical protein